MDQTFSYIDVRRANSTKIMLANVKIPLPDMMTAVMSMDDSVLGVDQIDNLIKFFPTKEEMELLKNYTGDNETLGNCEQYFLELVKVPRVESKLRVFSFKIQFETQITELKKRLNVVNSACEEVCTSPRLKEITKKILYLGNTLNRGTAWGAAVGFKLDSLLKLSDTRAVNNKMTLMHYLCKVLDSKAPVLLDFHKDLESLESGSKIKLKSLAEEMQAIIKGLKKLNQELVASENDGPISDVFRETLKDFISTAETEVATALSLYSVVGRNADALALYFGEDPSHCPFEQVVATLVNFIRLFKKAHQENAEQAKLEKKKVAKVVERDITVDDVYASTSPYLPHFPPSPTYYSLGQNNNDSQESQLLLPPPPPPPPPFALVRKHSETMLPPPPPWRTVYASTFETHEEGSTSSPPPPPPPHPPYLPYMSMAPSSSSKASSSEPFPSSRIIPPPMYGAPPPPPSMYGVPPPPPPPPLMHGGVRPHPPPLGYHSPGPPPPLGLIPRVSRPWPSLTPFNWVKITRALKGSLWDELQKQGEGEIASEFDLSEIETLFSTTVQKPTNESGGRRKSGWANDTGNQMS